MCAVPSNRIELINEQISSISRQPFTQRPFQPNGHGRDAIPKGRRNMPALKTMTPNKSELPVQFDPALFVNRDDVIQEIQEAIEKLQGDQTVKYRTIRISGERGVGKTWLLMKLHRDIFVEEGEEGEEGDVFSIFIDFDVAAQEEKRQEQHKWEFRLTSLDAEGFLELLKSLSQALGVFVPEETSIQEQAYWLVEEIKQRTEKQVVALLLDGLFAAPPDFVSLLEDYLLSPVISLPDTFIIMTGRGDAPLFSNYHLNNLAKTYRLRPFPPIELANLFKELKGQTEYKKLGENGLNQLESIYRASGGYPRTALILARDGLGQGVENAIDFILAVISNDKDKKEDKRQKIRSHLEAWALLNRWDPTLSIEWGIRDSDALEFLNAHAFLEKRDEEAVKSQYNEESLKTLYEEYQTWDKRYQKPDLREFRKELQEFQLIRWETRTINQEQQNEQKEEVRGWFTDDAVRYPVAYSVEITKPGLWQWLHYVGWRLFDSWAKRSSDKRFEQLAEAHHREVLRSQKSAKHENTRANKHIA